MSEVTSGNLSHLGSDGAARMVDVSAKAVTLRIAVASGSIQLQPATMELIRNDAIAKGGVLGVARVAGLQAVKSTSQLIPLCHSLPVDGAEIEFDWLEDGLAIRCRVKTTAKTGVEMEALTGVSIAALTIYDMCKAVDKTMCIRDVKLLSKTKTPLPL